MKNIHITSWFPYFGKNGEKSGKKRKKIGKTKRLFPHCVKWDSLRVFFGVCSKLCGNSEELSKKKSQDLVVPKTAGGLI